MTFGELVWNVSWNQRLHKVCTYRGLVGALVAALAHVCVQRLLVASRTSQKARCMECQDKPG